MKNCADSWLSFSVVEYIGTSFRGITQNFGTMKKLIALEFEEYDSLTSIATSQTTYENPHKKILSELNKKIQELLNLDLPAAEEMQLYNEAS